MHRPSFYKKKGIAYNIDDLTDEILIKVFSYLDKEELCLKAMEVCKKWAIAVTSSKELLQQLKFEGQNVSTNKICKILRSASTLQVIELVSVPKVTVIIDHLCRFNVTLKEITLKYCPEHIDVTSLKNLFTSCTHLNKINLKGTIFSADGLYTSIASLNELNDLTLSADTEYLNYSSLMEIILNCHHLECLQLFNTYTSTKSTLTDNTVMEIFQTLHSSLKSLTLDSRYLSSSSYSAIFRCKWLEDLHLIDAITFCGRQLKTFPKLLHLKSLEIYNGITLYNDDFIETFSSKNRRLQNLICFTLTFCFNLEDSGLEAILKICGKNLTSLNIEGCSKLTNNAIDNIVKYCNNVRYLNVAFTSNKKLLDYEKIPNNFPHLNVLVVDDSADCTQLRALQGIMTNLQIVISEVKLFKCFRKFV